jgi:hypothetical protein
VCQHQAKDLIHVVASEVGIRMFVRVQLGDDIDDDSDCEFIYL